MVQKLPILARLRNLLDEIRGSYWFLPTVMTAAAVGAAFGLVQLDKTLELEPVRWVGSIEAPNARSVLSVIAGSMITVTGVVFSITVVALTLASSQFGPRLLRNFLRDRSNQVAFGTFVSTFVYSLLVLRAVRKTELPYIASTVAVALAVVSLFVLIYFIHNTARSIQASTVIASVAAEIDALVPKLFPQDSQQRPRAESPSHEAFERKISRGTNVSASSNGYVRLVDIDAVLSAAQEHDLVIEVRSRPGDFVYEGNPLLTVAPPENVTDEISHVLRDSFVLGDRRTPVQDLRALVGQLTEIALRALSSGVNDPRTASDCVQRLGALVCAVAKREMPVGLLCDDSDQARLRFPTPSFEEIVGECFDPIRQYGSEHVQVVVTMIDALRDAAPFCVDKHRRSVLAVHVQEIHAVFAAQKHPSARDVGKVENAFTLAMNRINHEDASSR